MEEKEKKNKSGFGKFLFGAALGAAAGAAAAKYIHIKACKNEEELEDSFADAADSLVEDEESIITESEKSEKKSKASSKMPEGQKSDKSYGTKKE